MHTIVTPFTSQKFRFFAFMAMVLLVYVHGYNLDQRYLQPATLVNEPLTVTTFVEYLLSNGLFRFRIPILFIMSGYLFAANDDRPHAPRVVARARSLLLPYLLWSALGLLLTLLWEQWPTTLAAVVSSNLSPYGDLPVAQHSLGQLFTRLLVVPVAFQLWFIRCLFVYNLAYPWLKRAVMGAPRVTLGVFTLFWLASGSLWLVEGEGLLFFTLGVWLCHSKCDIDTRPAWLHIRPAATLWVAAATLKTWMAFQNDPALMTIMTILYKLVVALGMVVVWFGIDDIVRMAMRRRWFVWLTGFAFIIYALHVPLLNYAIDWSAVVMRAIPNYRLLVYLVVPLAVCVVCVMVGALLRRLSPSGYALLTGGRGL
jgi:fucose 4-O-acetylase-like acetyltransferase